MTQQDRVNAIVSRGYTERQARFLVLVMLHSGVCTMRQYLPVCRHLARSEIAGFLLDSRRTGTCLVDSRRQWHGEDFSRLRQLPL